MGRFLELVIPVNPVPASRPRVTRWGCYYGKRYTEFRNESLKVVAPIIKRLNETGAATLPLKGALEVKISFEVKRPKTTRLDTPKPDLDNYLKAAWDALTVAGLWEDDYQITVVKADKKWADGEPCIRLKVRVIS